MKIDNENDVHDSQSTIRRIQDYQEQQDLQKVQDERQARERADLEALQAQDTPDAADLQDDADPSLDAAADGSATDVQAQLQAQNVVDVNASRELSGTERSIEAVDSANAQQDRGEQWQSFAARDAAEPLPPSPEDLARQEAQSDAQDEANRLIRAQDLINQMTLQRGVFRG